MSKPKILYIAQEVHPYLPKTEMSVLSKDLSQSVIGHGYEVRTFMPKYGIINERRNQLHEVIRLSGMNIIIDDTDHPLIIKVATLLPSRMQVYFIDNDDYFYHNEESALEIRISPDDNDERMMFFVRGVAETVKKLRWDPAVIHCIGWATALSPLYIKHRYHEDPSFRSSKIVYSLFNDRFDGVLDDRFFDKLKSEGFSDEIIADIKANPVDCIALNKLAIDYADGIVEASEGIEQELIDYAAASGKPFLRYPGSENYTDAYAEFYASLQQ
ncbi:MAG: glycogen/starch synthase [Muribaculaceae bacterium]